ncbi:MAG: hypothetical protein BA874_07800 [Desulfuromonadales bacterium C00003068]|nr:MAG: hypothetical protein BA874_07800 [Desulfuromonadales bacterium C00003068]
MVTIEENILKLNLQLLCQDLTQGGQKEIPLAFEDAGCNHQWCPSRYDHSPAHNSWYSSRCSLVDKYGKAN